MRTVQLLIAAIMVVSLSGCGSSEQRALTAMIAQKLDNPPKLRVSDAVIYREGEARMACLTARWDNQWGETQPEAQFNAWYIPASRTWHTDNPRAVSAGGCQFYEDPDWHAKSLALAAERRAEEAASFDAAVKEMSAQSARD